MPVEIVMPRLSDSMEEATVVEWLVREGEAVSRGQPLVEIETDKATVTHEADADGVLLRIVAAAGSSAALGETIAIVAAPGAPAVAEPAHGAGAANGGAAVVSGASSGRVAASPLGRRVAADLGVDLAALSGSGPGGRVVRADVERAAAAAQAAAVGQAAGGAAGSAASAAAATAAPSAAPAPDSAATVASASPDGARGAIERQALTRTQATIAKRMVESRTSVPEFELQVDVDMSACVELRERLRELGADPLPSYNDIVVKAAAVALREHPRVNGSYVDGAFAYHERVNVGIAVAAEDALLVPTVFDADRTSLGEIARTTRALAAKVRDGAVTPADLEGGTFTVSNLGMFGIDSFTAVINQPQAAILAVGGMRKRAVVVGDDDQVLARPVMTLTLACDHRIVYGADGARFLARLRDLLEQPLLFVL
jgi:pyruvate dehydrogenase E2 component (dihydrolipoamide acetyltransferase)